MKNVLNVMLMFLFVLFLVDVVQFKDGDTLKVLDRSDGNIYDVRMYGIDAPEISQAGGKAAVDFLIAATKGEQVFVQLMGAGGYNRLSCRIYSKDGTYINAKMVENGLAWWYKDFAPNDELLSKLQEEAKTKKLGIWKDQEVTPPWEFRKNKKSLKDK